MADGPGFDKSALRNFGMDFLLSNLMSGMAPQAALDALATLAQQDSHRETVVREWGSVDEYCKDVVNEAVARTAQCNHGGGPEPPLRVDVWNGDRSEHLGKGTYTENVTVYFIRKPDGSLSSAPNAEREPTEEENPDGFPVREAPNNPKIILDSGRTVYGCQVWWQPIDEPIPEGAV